MAEVPDGGGLGLAQQCRQVGVDLWWWLIHDEHERLSLRWIAPSTMPRSGWAVTAPLASFIGRFRKRHGRRLLLDNSWSAEIQPQPGLRPVHRTESSGFRQRDIGRAHVPA